MLRDFKIVQNLWCQNKNVGFTESNVFFILKHYTEVIILV